MKQACVQRIDQGKGRLRVSGDMYHVYDYIRVRDDLMSTTILVFVLNGSGAYNHEVSKQM